MFGNIRLTFGTILENLRKSSENRQKCRHQYVYIIKRALHGSSNIPILCSRGKSNILYRAISAFIHCLQPACSVLSFVPHDVTICKVALSKNYSVPQVLNCSLNFIYPLWMSKVKFLALKEIQTLVHEVSVSLVLQTFIENLTKRVVAFCFHYYCLRFPVY